MVSNGGSTVKPLNSGHLWVLKNLSVIDGYLKNSVTFHIWD